METVKREHPAVQNGALLFLYRVIIRYGIRVPGALQAMKHVHHSVGFLGLQECMVSGYGRIKKKKKTQR